MEQERGILGRLIEELAVELDLTVGQLVKKIFSNEPEFSRSAFYGWMNTVTSVGKLEVGVIQALEEVSGKTFGEICQRLGINANVVPPRNVEFSYKHPLILPLIKGSHDSPLLKKAISGALRANGHWSNGMMNDAWSAYKSSYTDAFGAKAPWMATYIKLQMIKIAEVVGDLSSAESLFNESQEEVQRLLSDRLITMDEPLQRLAMRFKGEAQLNWLWANRWFHSVSEASIREGEELHSFIRQWDLYHLLPSLFVFLARCSFELGDGTQALYYVDLSRDSAYVLRFKEKIDVPLFLDAGGSVKLGDVDYEWLDDLISAVKADILIGLGRAEEAYREYGRIHFHRSPRTQWSFFRWSDPRWQSVLRQQTIVTSKMDVKQAISDDEWEFDFQAGGSVYLRGLHLYTQGQSYAANGDLLNAHLRFNMVLELADKHPAEDLYVKAVIADSLVQAQRGLLPFAYKRINMIEEKIHRITNPVILRDFQQTWEAIRRI